MRHQIDPARSGKTSVGANKVVQQYAQRMPGPQRTYEQDV